MATGSAITTTITEAATNLGSQALPIIAAAVTLGITFWGAKLLWGKFKGMAK